jgi:hypothetical protein
MPHYIVHIGPHKTGSSHLQCCLAAHRDTLDRAGIHVASAWDDSPAKPSHTGLYYRLTDERRADLEPVFAGWRDSDYRFVVISCEALAPMSLAPAQLGLLRELTYGSRVTIVYYVRRWSQLLASEWQQYVKVGSTLQLPEVLVHNLRDARRSRIINIDQCLQVFADIFGLDALRLVSYDSVVESGTDIFTHFTDVFLGGLRLPACVGHEANVSLSADRIELMRLFNILSEEEGTRADRLLRFLELQYLPAPMSALLGDIARHEVAMKLSDDDAAVRDVLVEARLKYAQCAVPPVCDSRFYESRTVGVRFIRPEYALTPRFAERVRDLRRALVEIDPSG